MVTQEELEKMSPEEIAELQKQNCIFCKIVAGEIPCNKVYEDEKALAFMDINPATKGHVLLIPKEHYPIFPVIPPEDFKAMFSAAQRIAASMSKILLEPNIKIFAANGAVAGQQINHAVLHIMPDTGQFEIPQNQELEEVNNQFEQALQQNISIMLRNHKQREGKVEQPQLSEDERREQIARILEENPQAKEILLANPEQFKEMIGQNPQTAALFNGVDIDSLSTKLKELQSTSTQESPTDQSPSIESVETESIQEEQPTSNESVGPLPSPEEPSSQEITSQETTSQSVNEEEPEVDEPSFPKNPMFHAPSIHDHEDSSAPSTSLEEQLGFGGQTQESQHAQDEEDIPEFDEPTASAPDIDEEPIFHGEDPTIQQANINKYFEEKPQAKELFLTDLSTFKELLEKRPDIQPLFAKVDLERLQEKLRGEHS